ncbi:transposase family protein [Streptomyces sp. MCA2]|uniref:transposase family protein n=1 Tax=Streptomyces sp. MCA2 TaxID=2944805 RepID=UPI0020226846|nr:transposase family protein [Streptomyces sp. MCA2]MCL7494774.1 transposase family protein [Streptomyces sp. MCA2]
MSNKTSPARGTERVVYQSSLRLSPATLTFLGDLLRGHLKKIGSRWRKLPPGQIATIVLAVLRHDQRLADMAGGNRISATTVRRWVMEVIGLLATRAERLQRALKKVIRKGGHIVLADGTLIRTRRRTGADNRRNYSGKHKTHGLLFLALTDDRGRLLWLSAARPGRSSEITTARYNHLVERLRAHELGAIGDLGFTGLDDDADNPVVITGLKAARTKPLTSAKKQVNKLIASVRAVCEHAFAHLKNWRILTKLRLDVRHATTLLRALLAQTHLLGSHTGARRPAVQHGPGLGALRHAHDVRAVGVEQRVPVGRQSLHQLPLASAVSASPPPMRDRCAAPMLSGDGGQCVRSG